MVSWWAPLIMLSVTVAGPLRRGCPISALAPRVDPGSPGPLASVRAHYSSRPRLKGYWSPTGAPQRTGMVPAGGLARGEAARPGHSPYLIIGQGVGVPP